MATAKKTDEKTFRFNDKVKVKMTDDRNGLKKGDIVSVHPTTAEQFVKRKIAEKV